MERRKEEQGVFALEELGEPIEICYLPTLEQLCEQEQITQKKLPKVVGGKMKMVLRDVKKMSQSNYLSPELLFIGQCYRALEKVGPTDSKALIKLKRNLSDFESVKSAYFDGVTLSSYRLALFRGWVTRVCQSIYPSETLCCRKEQWWRPSKWLRRMTYMDGEEAQRRQWVKHKENRDEITYVTQSVRADIAAIDREDFGGYFHSTSSSVFKGLIKHKALLSRDRLFKRRQEVLTSEGYDHDLCIYVDDYFNYGYQYSDVLWFGEYAVTFLIDGKKERGRPAMDRGISLGKKVPIEHIKMMFVPCRCMEKAKVWAAENMPWVAVHAIESGNLWERCYF